MPGHSGSRATATGSRPTRTDASGCSPPPVEKTSRRLSGVLTAYSLCPSADSARGRTCPDSNATNSCGPTVGRGPGKLLPVGGLKGGGSVDGGVTPPVSEELPPQAASTMQDRVTIPTRNPIRISRRKLLPHKTWNVARNSRQ